MQSKNSIPSGPKPSGQPKKNPFGFSMYWMYAIVFLFLLAVFYFDENTITKDVDYSQFQTYIEKDHGIKKIVVYSDKKEVEGYLTDSLASVLFPDSMSVPRGQRLK